MTNQPNIRAISCRDLHRASLSGPVELIDVRTPEEFGDVRAAIARNIPLDTLDPPAVMRVAHWPGRRAALFYLRSGARSEWACRMMTAAGYANVVNVEGGTQGWLAAGLPVTRGG